MLARSLHILISGNKFRRNVLKVNGKILYQGASMLDGSPIVVVATALNTNSKNAKTGSMIQTYIIRTDLDPVSATQTGADAAICGDCVHRGISDGEKTIGRTCYVSVFQGPLQVYKAFKRGIYPMVSGMREIAETGEGRNVRIGTYGDPAAVPVNVWQALILHATGHTGYTHQWKKAVGAPLRTVVMASADSENDAHEAQAKGWRTFRVALPTHAVKIDKEVFCPASAEAGKKLSCAQCLACSGANGRKGSIVIQAHGGFGVMANIKKRSELRI